VIPKFSIVLGVAINNIPKLGVIHKPYYSQFMDTINSRTYFGSIETGCYYTDIKDYMDQYILYEIERTHRYLGNFN
jgi:hypothetical protein